MSHSPQIKAKIRRGLIANITRYEAKKIAWLLKLNLPANSKSKILKLDVWNKNGLFSWRKQSVSSFVDRITEYNLNVVLLYTMLMAAHSYTAAEDIKFYTREFQEFERKEVVHKANFQKIEISGKLLCNFS